MLTLTETDLKSHDKEPSEHFFVLNQKNNGDEVIFEDQIISLREVLNTIAEIRDNTNLVSNFKSPTIEAIENQRAAFSELLNNEEENKNSPSSKLESHLKSLYETIINLNLIEDPDRISNFTVLTNNLGKEDFSVDFRSKTVDIFTVEQKKSLALYISRIGKPILLDDSNEILERIKQTNNIDSTLKSIVGIPIKEEADSIGVVLILEILNDKKLSINEIRTLSNFFNQHSSEINELKKAKATNQTIESEIEVSARNLADYLFVNSANHVLRNMLNPCFGWLSESPELKNELYEIRDKLDGLDELLLSPDEKNVFFDKNINQLIEKELQEIADSGNNEFLTILTKEFSSNGRYKEFFENMLASIDNFKAKFCNLKNDENIYLYFADNRIQSKKILADINESVEQADQIIKKCPQKIHDLLLQKKVPLTTIGSTIYIPFDEILDIKEEGSIISNNGNLLKNKAV